VNARRAAAGAGAVLLATLVVVLLVPSSSHPGAVTACGVAAVVALVTAVAAAPRLLTAALAALVAAYAVSLHSTGRQTSAVWVAAAVTGVWELAGWSFASRSRAPEDRSQVAARLLRLAGCVGAAAAVAGLVLVLAGEYDGKNTARTFLAAAATTALGVAAMVLARRTRAPSAPGQARSSPRVS
jgi:hypothetical protein